MIVWWPVPYSSQMILFPDNWWFHPRRQRPVWFAWLAPKSRITTSQMCPLNQFCTPVMTAVTERLVVRPTPFSSMTFCFHIQWKKSARAMGGDGGTLGVLRCWLGGRESCDRDNSGKLDPRTSHKCKTELILILTEPKEEEYKRSWMLKPAGRQGCSRQRSCWSWGSEREKGNQNEPGSLHCCKSSCYFDITKKLNLKQDRVNHVNLLIWFLETAKNMY